MLITTIPFVRKQTPRQIQFFARRALRYYPIRSNEILLNKYLIEHYKLTLKMVCLKIILKSCYSKSKDKIIITIFDKKLDDLAHLITFGNGRVQGSKILQTILR